MNIFSLNFWMQTFMSTLMTMLCIWLIKKATAAVNIPVVSQIAQEV